MEGKFDLNGILRFVIGELPTREVKVFSGEEDVTDLLSIKRIALDLDTSSPDWPSRTKVTLEVLARVDVTGDVDLHEFCDRCKDEMEKELKAS